MAFQHRIEAAHEEDEAAEREPLNAEGEAFYRNLVLGVTKLRRIGPTYFGKFAPEYPVDQLAIVDRNVLRLAFYELKEYG